MAYQSGQQVLHPTFGRGTIRSVSGSGDDTRLTIDFAGGVGQKKLLAKAVKLTVLGAAGETAAAAPPVPAPAVWIERCELAARPRPGVRVPAQRIHDDVRALVRRFDFWIAVRDRLRSRGNAPEVLDEPAGQISVSCTGLLNVEIRIRHRRFLRPDELALARAIAELIAAQTLAEFSCDIGGVALQPDGALNDADLVTIEDAGVSETELSPRQPLRRPKRVASPGTIRNRGRGRDDY